MDTLEKTEHDVMILGQKYRLNSSLDGEKIQVLAETVQELIETIKNSGANLSDQSAAVIAALNLAEQIVGRTAEDTPSAEADATPVT